jgi:Tol biopolymer transport system component
MAQPFDAASGQVSGEAFPIAENVYSRYAPATASETGVLLYQSGSPVAGGDYQLAFYDRVGKLLRTIGARGRNYEPALSPDERSIVFRRLTGSAVDLWLWDSARGTEQRITTDTSAKFACVWSPKGDRVVFASTHIGGPIIGGRAMDLYQRAAVGLAPDELLLANGNRKHPSQGSRDGRFIVYQENDPTTKWDIWVLPMNTGAERKPAPFLRSEFNELHGQLSPDDHWMAYTSDKTGQREVYVTAFPTGEGETRISIAGGEQPRWRGDGKELFFVGEDGKMMAVAVKAGCRRGREIGLLLNLERPGYCSMCTCPQWAGPPHSNMT